MFAAYVVVIVLLAPYVASSAAVDFAIRSRHRYGEGGVVESRLPLLGLLKGACGVGLLVAIGVPLIGTAAAIGVVLLFVCAVAV